MNIRITGIFLLMLLFGACANRVTPTGGIKDVVPPKFVEAIPGNFNTKFTSQKIELSFDELVMLKDLPTQLVISPLIEPIPEVKAIKNKIHIKIASPLRVNTTYTINFGKAIVDVHEGNPYENFQYVFSTGEMLDSLICTGIVKDAATQAPQKGITVMIYRNSDGVLQDSAVYKRKPDYFTRTDEQGLFNIRNIAAGKYSIYALDDKNNNYLADDPSGEPMAFYNKLIEIPQTDSLLLLTGLGLSPNLHLKNVLRAERGKCLIVFNQPADSINLIDFSSGLKWNGNTEWTLWKDSLFIYMKDTLSDSLNVIVKQGSITIDTVHLKIGLTDASRSSMALNKLRPEVITSPESMGPIFAFVFSFSRPVSKFTGEVVLFEDSTEVKKPEFVLQRDSLHPRIFSINYKWSEGKNYRLILPGGAFSDLYGFTNDTLKFNIHIPTAETTSVLTVNIQGGEANTAYLLQIVNEKFEVRQQKKFSAAGAYTFNYLPPGLYRIRIVKDVNENGKWDIGNYGKNIQPESVSVSGSLQLRANWELESEINCP